MTHFSKHCRTLPLPSFFALFERNLNLLVCNPALFERNLILFERNPILFKRHIRSLLPPCRPCHPGGARSPYGAYQRIALVG
ncbi:MAG: hypothetical protein LCH81_12395 [Bacteroidetes bacterium]|nr:hypothetical protein [Bacteroidota bacterium]